MKTFLSGSNQMDVPVKLVCPKAAGPIYVPALEFSDGVSHTSARDDPAGMFCRVVNARTVLALIAGAFTPGCQPALNAPRRSSSSHAANRGRSVPRLKEPAWPKP